MPFFTPSVSVCVHTDTTQVGWGAHMDFQTGFCSLNTVYRIVPYQPPCYGGYGTGPPGTGTITSQAVSLRFVATTGPA